MMLRHIARALGINAGDYSDEILLLIVMKEIERLKDIEQGRKWNRNITHDPAYTMQAAHAAYESSSHLVDMLKQVRANYHMGD